MQIYADKCFKNPEYIIVAFDSFSFKDALTTVEELSKSYYLLGYIRYEAKDIFLNKTIKSTQPLLYFEAYKNFEAYIPKNFSSTDIDATPDITFEQYKKAIKSIKKEIANGNTYEVNYTYDWTIKTDSPPLNLFNSLLKYQKTPYNALIQNSYETLLSFSPELFFEKNGKNIKTKPMKGTISRGANKTEDRQNIRFLQNDIKNRAENVMIVDLLRNDLGKIAKAGTVKVPKLFDIETHKTLHQMTSTVTAELKDNISLYNIFEAIFPCGSITGAPKISTMEIIDNVETGKRNLYCGAIGFLTPQKAEFSVPIRILQKQNDDSYYKFRVGGAIVWDSEIKSEWEETITKISFLKKQKQEKHMSQEKDFHIIETILAQDGQLVYAKEHFNRMQKTAEYFDFVFPNKLRNFTPHKNGIVRILLSHDGTYNIEYKNLVHSPTNKIIISPISVDSNEEFLYHKTTKKSWFTNALEKIKNGEAYDVIFFNEKGELTEGARSNILLQINEKIYTPPVHCGLLNGIMRNKLIDSGNCVEQILTYKDLKKAQKIFCINSVRGIKEVRL